MWEKWRMSRELLNANIVSPSILIDFEISLNCAQIHEHHFPVYTAFAVFDVLSLEGTKISVWRWFRLSNSAPESGICRQRKEKRLKRLEHLHFYNADVERSPTPTSKPSKTLDCGFENLKRGQHKTSSTNESALALNVLFISFLNLVREILISLISRKFMLCNWFHSWNFVVHGS